MLRNSSRKQVPPKGEASSGRKPWLGIILPVWVLVGFLVAQLFTVLFVQLLNAVGVSFEGVNSAIVNTLLSSLIYIVSIVIVIGVPRLVLKNKTTKQELGLHRLPTWRDIGLAPLGFIMYLFLSGILLIIATQLLPFIDVDQEQELGFDGLSQSYEYVMAFLTLVIIAPIAEEILFRGYLLGKLRKHVALWLAVLITSLLFGFVHFAWNVGIDTFALSILLCLLTIWSKSLWPAILLHMIKNFIAYYFLFIDPNFLNTIGG